MPPRPGRKRSSSCNLSGTTRTALVVCQHPPRLVQPRGHFPSSTPAGAVSGPRAILQILPFPPRRPKHGALQLLAGPLQPAFVGAPGQASYGRAHAQRGPNLLCLLMCRAFMRLFFCPHPSVRVPSPFCPHPSVAPAGQDPAHVQPEGHPAGVCCGLPVHGRRPASARLDREHHPFRVWGRAGKRVRLGSFAGAF